MMPNRVSVAADVFGCDFIRIIAREPGIITEIVIGRKEARQLSRALLCYADIADQLDQEWPDEKAVILNSQEVKS